VSRYLRRVLARTAGQAPGALRPAQPLRWSSQVADPFAAAELAASTAAEPVAPAAETGPEGAGVRARRLDERGLRSDPDLPPSVPAPRLGRRVRAAVRDPDEGLAEAARAARAPVAATGVATPPGATLAPPGAAPSPAPAAPAEARSEPSRIAMPTPPPRRREPVASDATAPRAHDAAPSAAAVPGPTVVVAVPPPPPVSSAAAPAERRPEIVIGRISVVVESARQPAPPRTVVRTVTATPRGEDGGASAPGFGRFGLGQL